MTAAANCPCSGFLFIAEAYRKRSYPNNFASKCTDSDAEASETTVSLDFAKDCGYITEEKHLSLIAGYEEVGKMLGSMIQHPERFLPKKNRRTRNNDSSSSSK